jgi:hypothetical protein
MPANERSTRHWTRRLRISCCSLLFALACKAAVAEELHGFVTFGDLPMPGATVTLLQSGKKFISVTDTQGLYSFPEVSDGTASIDIEMTGFVPVKQDITIAANTPSAKWTMTLMTLDEMRAALKPVASAPFTETQARSEPVKTGEAPKPRAGQLPAPQPEETTQRAQDGLLVNGSVNNAATSQYTLGARFGNTTNSKSLYNYSLNVRVENSALDAQSYSLTGYQTPKPQTSQITGGFAVQGPLSVPHVLRNGPNVYFGYQRTQNSVAVTTPGLVPDVYERAGNFSHALNAAGQPVVVYDSTGTPYPNNTVPISSQAQALLNLYPLPNLAGNTQYNYQLPLVTDTHQDDWNSNASKTVGRRDQLSGSFAAESIRTSFANLFGFVDTTRALGLSAKANWSHTYNSSWRTNLGYQYSRQSNRLSPYWANRADISGMAGITGYDTQAAYWGPPTLTFVGGLASLTDGQNTFTRNQTNGISYVVHWNRLQHNVTAGIDFRREQFNYLQQANPRGTFNFTGSVTASPAVPGSGSDVADFLVGTANTAAIAFSNPNMSPFGNADKYLRQTALDLYITDDWRVTPTLTLNVGARYEYGAPVTEVKNRLANIDVAPDFTAATTVVASTPKGNTTGQSFPNSLTRPDRTGIEPRIGVSWRPIAGSSLLLSGGYGITYDTSVYRGIALNLAQQSPFSSSLVLENSSTCPLTLASGLNCPGSPLGNTFGVDPNLRVGNLQTWDFKLQRDLPWSLQLNATYIGNKGTHGAQLFLPNTNAPGTATPPCPSCPVGFEYLTSGGDSTHEAGQLQLRRRLKSGFTASVLYAYSKSIDDDSALGGQGAATLSSATIAQDWRHLRAERGLSTFDQRNLLNVLVQYTTGMGKGGGSLMTGWRGRVYKEWTVQTQITAGSGLPETPLDAAVSVAGYSSFVRPNVTCAPLYVASGGSFLNRNAYEAPAAGQWGNARRNSITGPGELSLNAALLRTFRLNQRFNLDAQIVATNALNHVTFSSYYTNINSAQFGLPVAPQTMRTVQTSLRLRF